jgi:hypothetical protein
MNQVELLKKVNLHLTLHDNDWDSLFVKCSEKCKRYWECYHNNPACPVFERKFYYGYQIFGDRCVGWLDDK